MECYVRENSSLKPRAHRERKVDNPKPLFQLSEMEKEKEKEKMFRLLPEKFACVSMETETDVFL